MAVFPIQNILWPLFRFKCFLAVFTAPPYDVLYAYDCTSYIWFTKTSVRNHYSYCKSGTKHKIYEFVLYNIQVLTYYLFTQ